MRNAFRAYILPTPEEFRTLWQNAIFSFDASVLLNIYGYSESTREELLSLLERQRQRVWLPYQFGLEFVRNRVKVILKQVGNYQKVEDQLRNIKQQNFSPRAEQPFPSKDSLSSYEDLLEELAEDRRKTERLITNDTHCERVLRIFDGRVGAKPSAEKLADLHKEAKSRYDKKIPPGFEDRKGKEEPDAFSDYVGWWQLIEFAKAEQKSVIFVCDDRKKDWWNIEKNGRTIGPRYELMEEFLDKAQQSFYMYTWDSFLHYAEKNLAEHIKKEAIAEVSERSAANSELQWASALKPTAESTMSDVDALKPGIVQEELEESDIKPTQQGLETKDSKPKTDDKTDPKQDRTND